MRRISSPVASRLWPVACVLFGVPLLTLITLCSPGPTTAWAQPSSPYQQALDEAERAFQAAVSAQQRGAEPQARRLFEQAERGFRAVLRLDERHLMSLGRLAAILYQQRRHAEARALLEPVVAQKRADTEIRWQLALALDALGDSKAAVPLAEGVAAERPGSYAVFALLGRVRYRLGDAAGAAQALERYATLRPPELAAANLALSALRAEIYFRLGRHALAIAPLTECVALEPAAARHLRNLAAAQAASGQATAALATLSRLRGEEAEAPATIEVLAFARLALGEGTVALEAARRLAARASSLPAADAKRLATRAMVLTAAALAIQGRAAEARDAYVAALRSDSRSADAHAGLGVLLAQAGAFTEALEHLTTANRKRPRDAAACAALGRTYGRLARHAEAIASYRRCLGIDPTSAQAPARLAAALLAAYAAAPGSAASAAHAPAGPVGPTAPAGPAAPGLAAAAGQTTLDEAVALYDQARERDPASQPVRTGAALARAFRARLALGRAAAAPTLDERSTLLAEATRDLEAGRAIAPSQPAVLRDLAVVLLEQGRASEAMAALTGATTGADPAAELVILYARAAVQTGQANAGAEALSRLLRRPQADHRRLRLELAATLVAAGRPGQAAAFLQPIAASDRSLSEVEIAARLAEVARLLAAPSRRRQDAANLEAAADEIAAAGRALKWAPDAHYAVEVASALVALRRGQRAGLGPRLLRLAREGAGRRLVPYVGAAGVPLLAAIGHYFIGNAAEALAVAERGLRSLAGAEDAGSREVASELRRVAGQAWLLRASRSYAAGALRRSASEGRAAATYLPADDHALGLLRAALAYRSGQRQQAARLWRQLEPEGLPEALLGLGIYYLDLGERRAALPYLHRYLALGGGEGERVRRWIEITAQLAPEEQRPEKESP